MKFSNSFVLAFAACALAVPAPAVNLGYKDHAVVPVAKREEDCQEPVFHGHHKHKRAVVYEYAYVTVTVDAKGNPVTTTATTSTESTGDAQQTDNTSLDISSTTTIVQNDSLTSNEPSTLSLPSGTITPSTSSAEASSTGGSSSSSNGINGDLSAFQDPSQEFPDGVYSCDYFPSGQGVIALDHLGFGGWSGIYNSDTSTGGSCKEGSYCSYACQSGMSKTQWPDNQPSNGVSVGGLLCKMVNYTRPIQDQTTCVNGVPIKPVLSVTLINQLPFVELIIQVLKIWLFQLWLMQVPLLLLLLLIKILITNGKVVLPQLNFT